MLSEEGIRVSADGVHQALLVLLAINQLETRLTDDQGVIWQVAGVVIQPLLEDFLCLMLLFLLVKHCT